MTAGVLHLRQLADVGIGSPVALPLHFTSKDFASVGVPQDAP